MSVKHTFVCTVPEGKSATVVRSSNWNDDHQVNIDLSSDEVTGILPVSNGGMPLHGTVGQIMVKTATSDFAASWTSMSGLQILTNWTQTNSSAVDFIQNNPLTYNNNGLISRPVEYTNSGTISGGLTIFSLTDSLSNALFSNIHYVNANFSDTTAAYNCSYIFTSGTKILTVTAIKLASVLGILSLVSVPNGTNFTIFVKGN